MARREYTFSYKFQNAYYGTEMYEQKPRNIDADYILCSIVLCTYRVVP
jgi:hypothetical protein